MMMTTNNMTTMNNPTTTVSILDVFEYAIHYNDNQVLEDCFTYIRYKYLSEWCTLLLKCNNEKGNSPFELRFNELCNQNGYLKATSNLFWIMHNTPMEESDDEDL